MSQGLGALVVPSPLSSFLTTYIHRLPCFASPLHERLAGVEGLLPQWNIPFLIDASKTSINVRFNAPDGSERAVNVSAREAKELYGAGCTIYIREIPELQVLSESIAEFLSLPQAGFTTTLFASKRGAQSRGHFDISENFTVQVRGRKRWDVARNELALWPVGNWGPPEPVPSDFRFYAHREFPKGALPTPEGFELTPGAALYVPRGWWHGTETLEDSVSLHVHYPTVTWADIVLSSMRAMMLSASPWRAPARGFMGTPQERAEAGHTIAELLRLLADDLNSIEPEDFIGGAIPRPALSAESRIRRNPLAGFGVEGAVSGADDLSRCRVSVLSPSAEQSSLIELPTEFVAAALWFLDQPLSWRGTVPDVASQFQMVPEDARELIEVFLEAGLLRIDLRTLATG